MEGEAELFPAFHTGDRVAWDNTAHDTLGCVCERGVVVLVVTTPSGQNGYRVRWDADHGRWDGVHPARLLRLIERGKP